jgi:hypothetical protein
VAERFGERLRYRLLLRARVPLSAAYPAAMPMPTRAE